MGLWSHYSYFSFSFEPKYTFSQCILFNTDKYVYKYISLSVCEKFPGYVS